MDYHLIRNNNFLPNNSSSYLIDLLVKKLSKSTFPQENDEQLVSIALERGLKVQLSDKNPIVLHHIGFF